MKMKPDIIFAACIMLLALGALASDNPLQVQWRILPDSSEFAFRCLAANTTDTAIAVESVRQRYKDTDENGGCFTALDDPTRRNLSFGLLVCEDTDWPSPFVEIKAGGTFENTISKTEFLAVGDDLIVGHYIEAHWFYGVFSNPLTFAFPKSDGSIASPVVESGFGNRSVIESGQPGIRPIGQPHGLAVLAFTFNYNNTNELAFLFLNGSNETVTVEKPLTQASQIVATAPAIEYTKALFIAGQPSENIAIESGNVGEWRIPWKTVYELIPEADLAKIKEAGGDLDLVWKVGNYESPPLPISLRTTD
jgi:hypothetical protein